MRAVLLNLLFAAAVAGVYTQLAGTRQAFANKALLPKPATAAVTH